jgi:hypothetical protein
MYEWSCYPQMHQALVSALLQQIHVSPDVFKLKQNLQAHALWQYTNPATKPAKSKKKKIQKEDNGQNKPLLLRLSRIESFRRGRNPKISFLNLERQGSDRGNRTHDLVIDHVRG